MKHDLKKTDIHNHRRPYGKRRQPLRYLFLTLLLAAYLFSFSQKQHIKFDHIGTNMGLSQSNVICIFQDRRGFMWFGTRDGLNKYDGYKFTIYKSDAANDNTPNHNTIQDITEDSDGNLWIATWGGGLDMFNREKERFVHHITDSNDPYSIGANYINKLLYASDGTLWIATENHGLQMYDKKSGRFISYVHDENDPASINDNIVKDIVEDSQHNLWLATDRGGLNLFDRRTKTFRHFKHDEKNNRSLSSDCIWNLFIDSENQLWIGTRGAGLDLYDTKRDEFIHFRNKPGDNNSLPSDVIRSLNSDGNGNLWIGTENGGLSIFNVKAGIFNNYLHDDVDNMSLNNNSIWSVYKDRKGNMWVGTFSAGINLVNTDANKFTHFRHTSSPTSLSNNTVLSILEDSRANIWIGTDGGGVNLFDPDKGTFRHYMHEAGNPKSICGNYVVSILEDSRQDLWISTWGDGITVFNKEKNTFKHFKYDPSNPKGLNSANNWTIFEDSEKNIWIATYGAGISEYDRKHDSFIHYRNVSTDSLTISNNFINIIFEDKNGNLWLGTNGSGLDLFNKKTKTFTHFSKNAGKNSISNNDIFCLTEDLNGNLWIGTNLGLNRMDGKTGQFTNYFIKDGLPSNTIAGMLTDDRGSLWISTFNGLSCFSPYRKTFKNFGVNDGLQSNEFKVNSCYKGRNGRMYFGGINGFNGFFPDSVRNKTYEPPIVLTDLQILNRDVPISSNALESPLKQNITDATELVLSYKQSVISFEFASLNYAITDKNQYSYILEGFDETWNFVDTRHSATYTNLDAGTYIFKVRGLNNEGKWSSSMATIRLVITPPYWLTWWFKIAIFLAVIGSAIIFYLIRINAVKRQKKVLQRRVKEQTIQLEHLNEEEHNARLEAEQARAESERARLETGHANKELERKNKELEQFAYVASHDLQEPLRTTTSFVALLQKQYKGKMDEKADKYLEYIVQSSDRMKVLINDLLEYSRIGSKKELQRVDCNIMLGEVLADINAAIKGAEALIRTSGLPVISGYPTEIKQLFQNLLINAIKFRKKDVQPQVDIYAEQKEGYWQFAFMDNGIGIEQKHNERIFAIFQRLHTRTEYEGSGIGLAHCRKIVELHKGKLWVESVPGNGSSFYFTLPAAQTANQ